MLDKMQQFATWDKETQAACVLMYNLSQGTTAPKAPAAPKSATGNKPGPKPKNGKRKSRAASKFAPRILWTDEDRMTLWMEFEKGNKDWRELARKFGRSGAAISSQFYKYEAWAKKNPKKHVEDLINV